MQLFYGNVCEVVNVLCLYFIFGPISGKDVVNMHLLLKALL